VFNATFNNISVYVVESGVKHKKNKTKNISWRSVSLVEESHWQTLSSFNYGSTVKPVLNQTSFGTNFCVCNRQVFGLYKLN